MKNKIITICVTILLLLTCSFTVVAEDFDQSKIGSISVTLAEQKNNTPIIGAELNVYYVATATMADNGQIIYDYNEEFKEFNIAINDAQLTEKLDSFVAQNNLPFDKIITNANGTALCDELSVGLYFIKQIGAVDGFSPCKPFLVALPNGENGKYVYNVNATPKTEIEKLTSITIKKVWNTSASTKAADSVSVQLLNNGKVVKTAKLNSQNNWQITYDNMPESDAYSIKEVNIPKGFTATYKQDEYLFTVTNTSTLIQTGQLMWPIPVLAFSGMLLIAMGIIILRKKRKINA